MLSKDCMEKWYPKHLKIQKEKVNDDKIDIDLGFDSFRFVLNHGGLFS